MTRGPGASRWPPRPRTSQTRRRPPSLDPVRLRFFAGPEPADALRRFTEATGRQPKPEAPWVLGPWYQADDSEQAELALLREADAPLSVLQTYTHYLPCGDQVGREAAEAERIEGAHAAGVAITTYFNPMICTDYEPAYCARGGGRGPDRGRGRRSVSVPLRRRRRRELQRRPVRLLHRGRPGAVRQAARRGDRRRLRRLDGGLRRVHAARLGLRSRRRAAPGHLRAQPRTRPATTAPPTCGRSPPSGRSSASSAPAGPAPLPAPRWSGAATRRRASATTACAPRSPRRSRRGPRASGSGARTSAGSSPSGSEACRRSCSPAGSSWAGLAGDAHPGQRGRGAGEGAPAGDRSRPARQLAPLHEAAHPALPVPDRGPAHVPEDGPAADAPPGAGATRATRAPPPPTISSCSVPDLLVAPVLDQGATERTAYLPGGRWVDLWRSATYREGSGGLALGGAVVFGGRRQVTVPAPINGATAVRARGLGAAAAAAPRRHARRLRRPRPRPAHVARLPRPDAAARLPARRADLALRRGREAALA